jgi:hypothetical protein
MGSVPILQRPHITRTEIGRVCPLHTECGRADSSRALFTENRQRHPAFLNVNREAPGNIGDSDIVTERTFFVLLSANFLSSRDDFRCSGAPLTQRRRDRRVSQRRVHLTLFTIRLLFSAFLGVLGDSTLRAFRRRETAENRRELIREVVSDRALHKASDTFPESAIVFLLIGDACLGPALRESLRRLRVKIPLRLGCGDAALCDTLCESRRSMLIASYAPSRTSSVRSHGAVAEV